MSNNFGVLNNTLILQGALDDLISQLPPLTNLTLDVTDAAGGRYAKPGETITIKDWSAPFAAYQVGTAGYVAPDYNAKVAPTITLPNTPTAVSFYLTAAEYRLLSSGAQRGAGYETFLAKIKAKMTEGMGIAMIASFHAMIDAAITAGKFTKKFVSAAGTFNRATEIDLDADFFSRRVSRMNPTAVLSGAAFGEWSKDHLIIQNYTGNSQNARLMDRGVQSLVSPFTFYRTNVPLPVGAPRGYAATKSAALWVSRLPDEPTIGERDPVSLAEVVEPQTGIALLVRLWKNAQTGAIQMDMALIWAFAPAQDECFEFITAN